jgi:hypothetical protein
VQITNSNWKAVAINPSTPVNFPDSMTVGSLTIRGAWDTENVLLLNYAGTDVPLTVLNGLTVADNAQIVNLNSGLDVQSGMLFLTNAQIMQDGGFVRTTNATFYLQRAEYDLTNGVFEAGAVYLGLPVFASFIQYGGTAVISDLYFGRTGGGGAGGTYTLYDGYLSLPNGLELISDGNSAAGYTQVGGTNRTSSVYLEDGYVGMTLNGGLLADNDVNVMAGYYGTATLEQNGGTHVISNALSIAGSAHNSYTVNPATYRLNDGTLSARLIDLGADQGDSVFVQSNGLANAGTIYAHSEGYFASHNTIVTLGGGKLNCSNYTTIDGRGTLNQSGGALVVSNLLDFGGFRDLGGPYLYYAHYTFTGGTLTASNINMHGDWFIGDGTNRISNPGFFSLSHMLHIGDAAEQLGRFILPSNAVIDLAGRATQLGFANSSGETWAGGAMLVISNWNGNVSGGGAEQLKFGTSQSGLTPAQLSQIRFRAGYPPDLYSAKILNTGEVVPDHVIPPSLAFSRQGNNLVLTWPAGWFLQSANNVLGPYSDVPGATSPYTVDTTTGQHEFFRLRWSL